MKDRELARNTQPEGGAMNGVCSFCTCFGWCDVWAWLVKGVMNVTVNGGRIYCCSMQQMRLECMWVCPGMLALPVQLSFLTKLADADTIRPVTAASHKCLWGACCWYSHSMQSCDCAVVHIRVLWRLLHATALPKGAQHGGRCPLLLLAELLLHEAGLVAVFSIFSSITVARIGCQVWGLAGLCCGYAFLGGKRTQGRVPLRSL